MNSGTRKQHWESVYTSKGEGEVSWYQESPAPSLDLLSKINATPGSGIIDIGGGASRLVDALLARGYQDVTVLDLSDAALQTARERLGSKADTVTWIVSDVTQWEPARHYDVWHDRAAFHFLVEPSQQAAYADRLARALSSGGHAIIGTFAPDGPEKCSGLPVARHDALSLVTILGSRFTALHTIPHRHVTPWGSEQSFQFTILRRL